MIPQAGWATVFVYDGGTAIREFADRTSAEAYYREACEQDPHVVSYLVDCTQPRHQVASSNNAHKGSASRQRRLEATRQRFDRKPQP